ncbi:hypothetical protein BOTBODRAFT_176872 [Botryobasidium botryosum FD-172 SS1]|uniref:Uncharacterized protein n=1 Tax=Botryobasidium botryosum (strain FD-172 SS1) TaxID=930990 RepID=A0A067M7Z4_BOTB1|nr:hypothetical protein BOTBODRAFT_176872 [Botryobasidium botryosum FD-172 SS1]
MPHSSEDITKLPEVLPRILQDMFKVKFSHLTFDTSSYVVVYNLPLGSIWNWINPSVMAMALLTQNNITKSLPASPRCWLANPDRHKGASTSLCLSLLPQLKVAILKSGLLFFDGCPHPVRTFTAVKTKPNQCWRLTLASHPLLETYPDVPPNEMLGLGLADDDELYEDELWEPGKVELQVTHTLRAYNTVHANFLKELLSMGVNPHAAQLCCCNLVKAVLCCIAA